MCINPKNQLFGGWQDNKGKRPVGDNINVEVELQDGEIVIGECYQFDWSVKDESINQIVKWRLFVAPAPAPTPAKPASKAHAILQAGIDHMKDRAKTYDKPEGERSMEKTIQAFNLITGDGQMSSVERGWLFMVLLKAVRSQQGEFNIDNYEDMAAYAGLTGESAAQERG